MFKNFKKSYLVINIILALVLLFLILNFFTFKNTSYLFCILSVLIPFLIIVLIYGYERKKRRFMYELILYVFSYSLFIMLFMYLLGTFVGFSASIYKFNLTNIIHNIIPYIALIVVSEFMRYEITRKGENSIISHILITLVFVMIDMTLFYNTYNLEIGDEIIKYSCTIILPSIFKNIILLYFSKLGGMVPCLIYRFIFDLRVVLLPIHPNFGLYFESIIYSCIPVFLLIIMDSTLKNYKKRELDKSYMNNTNGIKYIFLVLLFLITIGVNLLASGKLKYTMISIGSGSMTPTICKGDVVIYEKSFDYSIGDILVFKKDGKVIVHRIIKIVDAGNDEYIYYTKGDANENEDGYPIEKKDTLGKVKSKIKYLGMPSVMLGELIRGGN